MTGLGQPPRLSGPFLPATGHRAVFSPTAGRGGPERLGLCIQVAGAPHLGKSPWGGGLWGGQRARWTVPHQGLERGFEPCSWGERSPPLLGGPCCCRSLCVRAVIHRARSLLGGREGEQGPEADPARLVALASSPLSRVVRWEDGGSRSLPWASLSIPTRPRGGTGSGDEGSRRLDTLS